MITSSHFLSDEADKSESEGNEKSEEPVKDKFEDLMYYKSKKSGSVLIPNPVHYSAIRSIRPPSPDKPAQPTPAPRVRTLVRNRTTFL